MNNILKTLNLTKNNHASYALESGWLGDEKKSIASLCPATGKIIASVNLASSDHYETIVSHASRAQRLWQAVPAPKRGELIRLIGDELRAQKDALGTLVSLEMGKIKQEGDGEVQEMIDMAELAVGQSRMLYGKTMHSERPQHRMYEQWHPLGIVGVISAFNFPVAVWAWNAFIAAIAGDVVIWKPSSKTPLCAIAVQHICNKVMENAGYPGVFSLFLPQQNKTTESFVNDTRIALISFTGSSHTGNSVAVQVAKRMGRSLLECSGNNAIIVDKSANLEIAIPAIVFGAVGTAGQRCTSTRRLFIHAEIYDSVLNKLKLSYQQIKVGDPTDNLTLLGPLINQQAVDNYLRTVEKIKQQGSLIQGGHLLSELGDGYFVEPVIAAMRDQSNIVKQETFAPILYVMQYTELSEAISMQNDVPQGLSSSIFTRDLQQAEQFLSNFGSDCGIANVNMGTSGAEIGGAFGGEKSTGGGREAGSDCWKTYMRRQTNCINWGDELPLAQGIQFPI